LVVTFDEFARESGPRLRAGLVAACGPDRGLDAAAEALAYGWEHWDRVGSMDNPVGYLYRVGQTAARRLARPLREFPTPDDDAIRNFEPQLIPALGQLSESQRVCVLMVHGLGWSQVEVADLLEISSSSVRTHLTRALKNLRDQLKVVPVVE
jgi:RNA polymerase sigma factor (sigma-70 family)